MLGNSFWIGSIHGIGLGVHPSWLTVLTFFPWLLAGSWSPAGGLLGRSNVAHYITLRSELGINGDQEGESARQVREMKVQGRG